MADAYIIDAARTPRGIGKAGRGALAGFHSGRLLAKVFEAIGERNQLNTADIDDVVVGCSSRLLLYCPRTPKRAADEDPHCHLRRVHDP
mgnify:CR=1 FL=1